MAGPKNFVRGANQAVEGFDFQHRPVVPSHRIDQDQPANEVNVLRGKNLAGSAAVIMADQDDISRQSQSLRSPP